MNSISFHRLNYKYFKIIHKAIFNFSYIFSHSGIPSENVYVGSRRYFLYEHQGNPSYLRLIEKKNYMEIMNLGICEKNYFIFYPMLIRQVPVRENKEEGVWKNNH